MRTQLASLLVVLGCALTACGDDGGGSGIDAQGTIDAPVQMDAPAAKQIGSACTPDQNNPAGDCGAGFVCLVLEGGSAPYCSKTCTQGTGDMCGVGYTGTGRAACVLGVQPMGGGTVQTFCGIVCSANDPQVCPASQCNGTCPGTLQCTAALQNQQMQTVAMACN
ncbi:MAG: hypothetical protein SFX73_32830 [Kofleriaceae bacterium]|nr:hypothetical protein [Kofleriaceae bacterium]